MADSIEQYQGFERDQAFVRKYDDLLWTYCQARFRKRWGATKRAIPMGFRHDGEEGWFFPKTWLRDFVDERGDQLRSLKPMVNVAARVESADRASAAFDLRRGQQVSAAEAERWALPVGSVVSPEGVQYPDGVFETLDEIRLRKGKYVPGAQRRLDEQQNLEDMLRLLHERREADANDASTELASSNLARADWTGARAA